MTDKLYARKRIRIPKIKFKKWNFLKMGVFLIIIFVIGSIGTFLYYAYPIFKATCETAAGSKATNITNEEVANVMQGYTYEDLMHIQKDENGTIRFLEVNLGPINEVVSKIVSNIQKRIDASPRTTVFINMGAVSGISILKNIGPQFDIELETAGRLVANVRTEFESVGINQSLHKIYLDINTNMGILTPYGNFTRNFENSVLLTQAVIVGEVPETYYEFNGSSNTLDDVAVNTMQ